VAGSLCTFSIYLILFGRELRVFICFVVFIHAPVGWGTEGLRLPGRSAYAQGIEMANYLAVSGTQAPEECY